MKSSKVTNIVTSIYQLLMINVCFLLTTFPLLFAFVAIIPSWANLVWYILASITLGPSLFSLAYCLRKIREEKEIFVFSTYFTYFKKHFIKSMFVTLVLELVTLVGVVDMLFFSRIKLLIWLNPLLVGIILMLFVVYLNMLYLYTQHAQFDLKTLLRQSFYYGFKKWYIGMANVFLFACLIMTMIIKPVFGFVVFPSLIFLIIHRNNDRLLPE